MYIQLYNTLSRKKERFTPGKQGSVSMYHCGPTVYDTPHIGNYRTFIMNDLLRRLFEYNGYDVAQAMNITDVDDKTINRSRSEHLPLHDLTRKYEKLFLSGLDSLNILRPQQLARATDNIGAMIELIETLVKTGAAYRAEDGVYMSISKIKDYGALAGLHLAVQARAESNIDPSSQSPYSRIRNDEYDKESPRDFALWKFATPEDGDTSWEAPFGKGRPGWHIECSAMSMKLLGETIDIHTGGADLIFPHHTNEIAQSETATGKTFVRYWMHGGFMNVAEEKMAKSKGNFIKLDDLLDESISPLAYRYWLLTAHYRSPVNFTFEAVRAAQNALIRLITAVGDYPEGGSPVAEYRGRFLAAVNDDLDTPRAVALMWELMKDDAYSDAEKRATIIDFDYVFGLKLGDVPRTPEEIPKAIAALSDAREEARKAKDWKKADALRAEIEARGYELKDTPDGPVLRSLSSSIR